MYSGIEKNSKLTRKQTDLVVLPVELINFLDIPYDLQIETLRWRNSEKVSQYFKIKEIDIETHKNWLKSLTVENPKNIAFLIQYLDTPVGVTYFHSINYTKRVADWGIYIKDEQFRGKHIGSYSIKHCIMYAKEKLKLKRIYLDVLNTNVSAITLYTKTGFKRFVEDKNEQFYRYYMDI